MRCLITGGAGFIGSHLADELLTRGHRVHALDDLSTGRLENVEHLRERPDFELTVASAEDTDATDALMAESDVVFHLAAAVGVELVVESPVRTLETNLHCTEVVLASASRHACPVILTSTSEVYGKSIDIPFREDGDLTLGATSMGRWAYACSKAVDEFLAIAYWKERRLPTVVARLFNTVGPRQTATYGMVIPRFVGQALADEPLSVYGSGSQQRCFCHVTDIVGALIDLIQREDAYGEVYNLGSSEEVTILELAERVIAVTGSASEIAYIPYHEAYREGFEDMHRRIPDTTKVAELLGWAPTRSLDSIIVDVVESRRGVWAA